jgi:ABC-type antimicrobial peptide transport system permease subunit
MAFSVTQRSQEMALRMALGATRGRVIALVAKEGMVLACTGLGFGLIGAWLVGRAMQSMLFGVGPIDFPAFGVVGLLLLFAALFVMDPKSWTQKWPFLRWSAALKMKESQCHERVRATQPA